MSDQPSQTNSSENKAPLQGGWQSPVQSGMWRAAADREAPQTERVPALPKDLSETPQASGGWHLPSPEDTTFTPEEEIEIRSPEDELWDAAVNVELETPTALVQTVMVSPITPEDALFRVAAEVIGESAADLTPPQSPEDMIALLEQIDEDTNQQSGLTGVLFAQTALDEASPEVTQAQQPTTAQPAVSSENDDYYRRQMAELEDDDFFDVPSAPAAAPPMDARTEQVARRFAEVEEQVRALQRMVKNGDITRDQLVDQAKELMILDDDQVYWSFGPDTEQWHKYLNGEWVVAQPPRLPSGQTLRFTTDQILDESPAAQPSTSELFTQNPSEIRLDENNMPLPRQVSQVDLGATMVSDSAFKDYQTMYNVGTQPTIANPAVQEAQPFNYGTSGGYGETPAPLADADGGALPMDDRLTTSVEPRPNNGLRWLILAVAALGLFAVILGGIVLFASNAWYNGVIEKYAAQIGALANYQPEFQTITIQDYEGNTVATLSQGGNERVNVRLSDINPLMIHAIVSNENPTFYTDPEWGFGETLNGFFVNLQGGQVANPTPTIPQQIARRFVLNTSNIGTNTSIEELAIAGELSKRYSKELLLELYLNEIFLGNQSFGVEAASRFYFKTPARDLNLPQAAMLAGMAIDPVTFDPVVNRDPTFARMHDVMRKMAEVGCLNTTHAGQICVTSQDVNSPRTILNTSVIEAAKYTVRASNTRYTQFVAVVRQQLEAAFPNLYTTGLVVRTTLVPEIQDRVNTALVNQIRALEGSGVTSGAVVYLDPKTGAVRAYVGSADFGDATPDDNTDYARLNHAPGETIIPLVYAAALEGLDRNGNGALDNDEYLTPASIVWDVASQYTLPDNPATPITVPSQNGVYYGPVSVRTALQSGYNAAAVDAYNIVGDARFASTANAMGALFARTNPTISWLTAIGETPVRLVDMVAAYGTISNGGTYNTPYVIEGLFTPDGQTITIPESIRPPSSRAISPQTAYLLSNMMSDDAARNTSVYPRGSALTLNGFPAQNFIASAAGTSEGNRDLWTVGFSTNAAVGVWLGRADGNSVQRTSGFAGAAPLWNEIMALVVRAQPTNPAREFTNPGGVVVAPVCPDTGASTGTCPSPSRNELFVSGRPAPEQGIVQQVSVNTWTRQTVNQYCPSSEDMMTVTAANITNQYAIAWLRSPQGAAYARRIGLPDSFTVLPLPACDVNTVVPQASITSPVQGQEVIGNIAILGQVNAPPNFSRYQLEVAPGTQGGQFRVLPGFPQTIQQPNPNATLGTWDTTLEGQFPNGQYRLRLSVIAQDGGYIQRTVVVNVNNPIPTATPSPTPTNTPEPPLILPTVGFTPLPFDTPAFAPPIATLETPVFNPTPQNVPGF